MVAYMDDASLVDDLESLFRAHHGRLVRALTVACGDEQRAADAVQHAFVKAHLRWRKIATYEDPVGWIRRVAINRLRDEHRSDVRKRRAIERMASEPTSTSDHYAGESGIADLGAMLAALPRQQRLALALFYVDDLSVNQVAAALDISPGTVKFHLHQGRNALRGSIDTDTDTDTDTDPTNERGDAHG
ncbi:MAG: SigE family polymerase sigma factor [Ilumatobacteraceae bacterium]|nr:SigE family polymerase sigma factor [Ilumatobacteraceae bacterium]